MTLPEGVSLASSVGALGAGVDTGDRWQVRLDPTGPLGGTVGKTPLATAVKTAGQ